MRPFRRLLISLLFIAGCLTPLAAQPSIDPANLTNRPLAYLNDASSVGWNPAVLGVHWDEFEILAAGGFDRTIALRGTIYSAFGKFGPVAIGASGVPDNSFLAITPQ